MEDYSGYSNLGKTKMIYDTDQSQQYYQPTAKKSRVDFQNTWQQPQPAATTTANYGDYSSYYQQDQYPSMLQQQQQQQQVQQTPVDQSRSYVQSSYDNSQYAYSSYTQQDMTNTAAPQATYECPLYDQSLATNVYSTNSNQQRNTDPDYYSTSMTSNSGGGAYSSSPSGMTGNSGYQRGGRGRGSSQYQNSNRSRGTANKRGSNGSTYGNQQRKTNMGGFGNNNSGNAEYMETDQFSGYQTNGNSRGRFASSGFGNPNRGASRGIIGGTRGQRGRGRGKMGGAGGITKNSPQNTGGANKWETLPGGTTRTNELKKPVKTEKVDASHLPLPEKFQRLCIFLRNEKRDVNEIMMFENSLMSCKLGVRPDFVIDDSMQGKNGSHFTGRLILDGVFLTRNIGTNKKQIKLSCYRRAVEMCRTMSVQEIMSQKDLAPDAIKQKLTTLNATVKVEKVKVAKEVVIDDVPTVDVLANLQNGVTNPKYFTDNPISGMEIAASVSKCRSRCRFDMETKSVPTKSKAYYEGSYYVDNILLGFGACTSKKKCKANCYEMVCYRLKTETIKALLDGLDSLVQKKIIDDVVSTMPAPTKTSKFMDLKQKFTDLKEQLESMEVTENLISEMDAIFNNVKLTQVSLYRKGPKQENAEDKSFFCNLYLAGRLVAIGEAVDRKDATLDAYTKAKEVVLKTDQEAFVSELKKLDPADKIAPDVIDFRVKGNCVLKNLCTNYYRLMKTKLKVSTTSVKDIVLFEHGNWSSNRKAQSFCILQHSCYLNNMLLEWNFCDADTKVFRCDMKIQNEEVMTQQSQSVSKIGSRSLAAADILFKLYETHPVIQINSYTNLEADARVISLDEVLEEATELHRIAVKEGKEPEPDSQESEMEVQESQAESKDIKVEDQIKTEDGSAAPADDKKPQKGTRKPPKHLEKFITQVFQQKLEKFTSVRTLEDLLFGPSYRYHTASLLNKLLRKLELPVRFMSRPINHNMYTIVTQSMTPREMLEYLQKNGGTSGRFKLIESSTLPTHKDIEAELKSGELSQFSVTGDEYMTDGSFETSGEFHTANSSTLDNSAYASMLNESMTPVNVKKEKNSSFIDTSTPIKR